MTNCLFCSIVNQPSLATIVHEDEQCIAILDINPIQQGHTLVIPKKHSDKWYETDEKLLAHLLHVARKLSPAIERSMKPKRVALAMAGLGVAHLHLHLVPMQSEDDMTSRSLLEGTVKTASQQELETVKKKILHAL